MNELELIMADNTDASKKTEAIIKQRGDSPPGDLSKQTLAPSYGAPLKFNQQPTGNSRKK